ncbi:hypothetical protein IV203_014557 [Nitzschia inconspicua]|uniref:Uncharacterized protein n=1 Tax=Nitzschia inconspicua TaxID=303405 RepID=A0A9K3L8W2_9STRA|nr:hypothetical protein IV203_014552 [Nitzschia inconspicua]KAG7357970.1 hypothetical protein IV203_014557 [Nitzschia inconspicua]
MSSTPTTLLPPSPSRQSNKIQRIDDRHPAIEKEINEEANSLQQMNDHSMYSQQTAQQQLMEHDFGRLMVHALSFLDVVTLLRKQVVSKQFKDLCTKAITAKCGKDGPEPITDKTIRYAVRKFCYIKAGSYDKQDMEKIACTYGFPIDSWNVSQVTDMSKIFFLTKIFLMNTLDHGTHPTSRT